MEIIWYKQSIKYSRETIVSFLRGLYDSDDGHYKYKRRYSQIHLSSNNLKLLKYTQHLLEKYFDIFATGPYLNKSAGTENKIRNGKIAKTNYDNYCIHINRRQRVERFLSVIGFSIISINL